MARKRRKNTNKKKPWWLLLGILLAVVVYANWGQMNNRPGYEHKNQVSQELNVSNEYEESEDNWQDNDQALEKKNSNETNEDSDEDSFLGKVEKLTKGSKKSSEFKKNPIKEEPVLPPKKIKKPTIKGKAKIAILLDDFGYGNKNIQIYNALPIPLTYAVLPYHTYSSEAAKTGHAAGKDIMVHLPMESISNKAAEKMTLRTTMSDSELKTQATKAISSIPYAVGINNHQGSKASADKRVVGIIMNIVRDRGLFFFDSRTTSKSLILPMARNYGVPTGTNDLFLDNDSNVSAIEARLEQATKMALNSKDKYVIVIGHDRPNTAIALRNMYTKMQNQGIEFVFVKSLLY